MKQVLLTQTETIVQVAYEPGQMMVSPRSFALLAGGRLVGYHLQRHVEGQTVEYIFDRLEPGEQNLTLRMSDLQRSNDGGPAVPVVEGAVFQDESRAIAATVERATIDAAQSRMVLRAEPSVGEALTRAYWFAIVDEDGRPYTPQAFSDYSNTGFTLELSVPGAIRLPAALKAILNFAPVEGTVEVAFELK